MGKLRLSEEKALLREQHGVGSRAKNASRSLETDLARFWYCNKDLLTGGGGGAVTMHRAQGSQLHPRVDLSEGLGLDCLLRTKWGM